MKLKKKEPKGWDLRAQPNMESLAKLINKAKGDNRTRVFGTDKLGKLLSRGSE